MRYRSFVMVGIVLLSLWSCAAAPEAPPAVPAAKLELPRDAADPSVFEGPRARIGPIFDDAQRSQVPLVGTGSAYFQGPTGIAAGAVPVVRGGGSDQQVAVFDARTGEEVAPGQRPVWLGPAAPKVSADGRYLVYVAAGFGREELVLWDLQLNQRVGLPELENADVREVDISGDGQRLIYVKGGFNDTKLAVFDRRNGEEREIALPREHMVGLRSPTLSADGKTAAYVVASARGDANINLMDLATHHPISPPTLNSVDQDTDPALDAKGEVVMFSSDRNGSYDLFAYDLRTSVFMNVGVFNSLQDETLPRFLGLENSGIAYVSTRDGGPVAYMHPFSGWR